MTVGLRRWAVSGAVAVACLFAVSAVRAEPDEQHLGKDKGYPLGDARSWYFNPNRVGAWSALDRVPGLQTRSVPRGEAFTPLLKAANPREIRYHYQNRTLTLADYLERQRATGLLILKNGEIVAEHYRYGRKDDARFISFSMAKSVTSVLVGIAQERGHIASLDDKAEKYVKPLAGSPYGGTAIRHLLRMSSGLTYTERHAPPGEKFSYASTCSTLPTPAASRPASGRAQRRPTSATATSSGCCRCVRARSSCRASTARQPTCSPRRASCWS